MRFVFWLHHVCPDSVSRVSPPVHRRTTVSYPCRHASLLGRSSVTRRGHSGVPVTAVQSAVHGPGQEIASTPSRRYREPPEL